MAKSIICCKFDRDISRLLMTASYGSGRRAVTESFKGGEINGDRRSDTRRAFNIYKSFMFLDDSVCDG